MATQQIEFFEHPGYSDSAKTWRRHRDLYVGDHDTLVGNNEYLWPHQFELTQDGAPYFGIRRQRTRYLNLMKILIAIWQGYYFKREPEYSQEVLDMLGAEIDNIDGQGSSLFSFLKDKVLSHYLLYGKVITLVDSFSDQPETVADEKESGMRPVISLIHPLDMKDWQTDLRTNSKYGRFDFLRHEYSEIGARDSATVKPKQVLKTDELLLNQDGQYEIRRYKSVEAKAAGKTVQYWEPVGEPIIPRNINGALDQIPVFVLESECPLSDASEECVRYFNKRSILDSIDLHQGYKKLFISGGANLSPDQRKAVTEYAIGLLPTDADLKEVQPTDTGNIRASLSDALDTFFKVGLRQTHSLPADSREAQSAEAQAAEKSNATGIVLANIEQLENYTNAIIAEYAKFKGIEDFEGRITLSREVEFESLESQVLIWNTLRDELRNYPAWKKSTLKRIAKFQNLPDEEYQAALVEIEETAPASTLQDATVRAQRRAELLQAIQGDVNQDDTTATE